MEKEKTIDTKAWVRQRIAIIMACMIAFNIIAYWIVYAGGEPIPLLIFAELMAVPVSYVGWFFKARDTEKRLKYQETLSKLADIKPD